MGNVTEYAKTEFLRELGKENDRLRALNAELVEALRQIEIHDRNLTGAAAMQKIASAALAKAQDQW